MARYKLTLEYDGTGLAGWQKQKDVLSLQKIFEDAILDLTQEKVEAIASGRTDAGVHAYGQVVHVDITKQFEPYNMMLGINFYLHNKPIAVVDISIVDDTFHARFDAKKRYYRYQIINRKAPIVLQKNRAWNIHHELDIKLMRKGAEYLLGNHDFASFRAAACQAKNSIRTIDKIEIIKNGEVIFIDVEAKSFLHHMVRNIVGTLKMVGTKEWQPEKVQEILEAKNRIKAGSTAPACGLFFMKVKY